VSAQPANCPNCSAPLPRGARFCASCGTALQSGDTARAEVPPHETGPVPVTVAHAAPRWFGLAPPTALFAVAAALLVVAVVLLVIGSWVAGLILLGLALLFAAAFLEAGRRKPDAPIVTASIGAVDSARARAGATAQAFLTRSSARREITRRRAEAMRLGGERDRLLRELGAAAYAGADGAAERDAIAALDEQVAGLEREASEIAASAQERVRAARLQVQPTEIRTPDRD
jgi:zinc-ribbon domain